MSKSGCIIACIASFILGIASMYLYYNSFANRNAEHERWIKLSKPSNSEESLVSYSSDALFNSDIKLPNVTALTGKAKFVKGTTNNASEIKLGYAIDVDIAPLDTSKIPEKYKPAANESPEAKKPPLDVVYYEVVFYFVLKDKDGFPLMKAASNKETVHSGATNHFQLFANSLISSAIAANTEAIDVRMEAIKCLTCESDQPEHSKGVEGRHRKHSLF